MKKFHIKTRNIIFTFILLFVLIPSLYSENMEVANFPDTYSAANGIYIPNGTVNGYNSWVHEKGGYYIYYNAACSDWEIFNRTDVNSCTSSYEYFAYTPSTTIDPPVGLDWETNTNMMASADLTVTVQNAPLVPEINVLGNNNSIIDGNIEPDFTRHTKFGSASISSSTVIRTYTIQNKGTESLTILSVVISGANADQFSVSSTPSSSIIAGGSTTFTVTFSPSTTGIKNATININNNDSDEGLYNFSIEGYGYTPDNLSITGITGTYAAANTGYIHQGVINGYEYWMSANNYYIYSNGYRWCIDNDLINTSVLFYASENAMEPSVLDASGWILGNGEGTPFITAANPNANINLKGNNSTIAINDNTPSFSDLTMFGSIDVTTGSDSRTRTYTIENTGGAPLTISSIVISGEDIADFSQDNLLLTTIPAYSSTSFTVTFKPSTIGTKSAFISIVSNDADESPYQFYIAGDAFVPEDLVVSDITGTYSDANGLYIYQGISNEFQYWKHESLNYYIYNKYFDNSRYWNIDIDTDDASQLFFNYGVYGENVSPVNVPSWRPIEGAGTPIVNYAIPEIDIKGNSISIVDSDSTPSTSDHTDFGEIEAASGTIERIFTINNTGYGSLNLSGTPIVEKSGPDEADFTITQPSSTTLSALTGTITFAVEFNPSAVGLRTAELSISNDDGDENPYNFRIQGTGTNTAPTVIAPSTPIVNEDATNVALVDDIQVTDIDGDDQTVTFTITGGTVTLGTSGITFGGSGNGSSSFTASGTLAAINTALDSATFTPTANLNGINVGTISFIANDGTATSSAASVTFNISAENDAPIANAPSTPTVNEDAINVALANDIQVVDIDGDAQTVTFTITGGTVTLGTTGITFGGSGNGSSSFTASGTLAAINIALDSATFTPTTNLNGTNAGVISFTTNDGTVTSSVASVIFNISGVNDAPTFTSFAGVIATTNQNTEIEITLAELEAHGNEADIDGTVNAFIIKVLSAGTLRIGISSATSTAFNATTNKTIDATNNAYWTPPTLFVSGEQNAFTTTVLDNSGAESSGKLYSANCCIQLN